MSKPSIYAYCTAGCKWETRHKEDVNTLSLTQAEFNALGDNVDTSINYIIIDADYFIEMTLSGTTLTTSFDFTSFNKEKACLYRVKLKITNGSSDTYSYIPFNNYRFDGSEIPANNIYNYYYINENHTIHIHKNGSQTEYTLTYSETIAPKAENVIINKTTLATPLTLTTTSQATSISVSADQIYLLNFTIQSAVASVIYYVQDTNVESNLIVPYHSGYGEVVHVTKNSSGKLCLSRGDMTQTAVSFVSAVEIGTIMS